MSDVLSQDEINALLEGVAGDAVAETPAADAIAAAHDAPAASAPRAGAHATSLVQSIDLMKQERSVQGRLPGLDMILEQFMRTLRVYLGATLGKVPTVNVSALEQLRFGPVQQRLQMPTGIHLFRLTPLRGQGLLIVPPEFVTAVLQVSFGGDPKRPSPASKRDFSAIETVLLQKCGDRILGLLRDAFKQVEPIEFARTRTETNPLFAGIVGPQDIVLVIEFRLEGEGLDNVPLTFCIPNASLDPIRQRLQEIGRPIEEDDAGDQTAWHDKLHSALADVEVEVAAELGRKLMPMQAVLALAVGDLISLGTGRDGPVVLKVAGRGRFVGTPGVSGGSNAVQVTGPL